jgi:phenylpropionate dioxygenase-like ring-hydroxylating dioxygenase large terminal subunit
VKINLGVGMSDLASLSKLARSDAQLPVNVYFDESLLQREIKELFQAGPRYVGHELMVPNVGDLRRCKLKTKAVCWFAAHRA